MILIYSAFGAQKNYPDQGMMEKTLSGFIKSVGRQTDQRLKLFLVGHDKPALIEKYFISWHSLSCDENHNAGLTPKVLPKRVSDTIEYQPEPTTCKLDDMSRKTRHGIIQAVLWAYRNGLKEFWLMRMDSDDLLAIDTIEKIHTLDEKGIRAVFNRICHMFDAKTKRIAIHSYPYSTTPNALKFKINDDGTLTPDWFYLCSNHTLFYGRVKKDGIPWRELDFTYCIVTNTGNSISGRPALNEVDHNREVPLSKELIDRYGIGELI